MSDFFSMDEINRNARWQSRIDKLRDKIDALTAELKTANTDRDDLVDRLCAVEGEYASLASTSGELSSKLLRTIDALTAERDAARAELARLRERLTKLADENEAIGRNHDFFVGSPAHAACAITWGIAGLELRKALGEDVQP